MEEERDAGSHPDNESSRKDKGSWAQLWHGDRTYKNDNRYQYPAFFYRNHNQAVAEPDLHTAFFTGKFGHPEQYANFKIKVSCYPAATEEGIPGTQPGKPANL
jgi:hypothetical protein